MRSACARAWSNARRSTRIGSGAGRQQRITVGHATFVFARIWKREMRLFDVDGRRKPITAQQQWCIAVRVSPDVAISALRLDLEMVLQQPERNAAAEQFSINERTWFQNQRQTKRCAQVNKAQQIALWVGYAGKVERPRLRFMLAPGHIR